jgi:hypothetical protein
MRRIGKLFVWGLIIHFGLGFFRKHFETGAPDEPPRPDPPLPD